MWLSLFLGYCLFCANWLIFSKLKGSNGSGGWNKDFQAISTGVTEEAVNYSVTIARGVFTIPASMILVKLGYKRACLLAFGLSTIALPLIFSPHWTVLILGRLIMAAGGTLTIIYISPLLAKLAMPEKKQKLAMLNGFTYAISGLIVNVLFMIQPVSTFLIQSWKWVAASVATFSFFPLILFYFCGENFEIVSLSEKLRVGVPENYSTLLREKESWVWIITYSGMLVVSILCSSFVPRRLTSLVPMLSSSIAGMEWSSLYTVIFFIGTFCGLYFLGRLNPKDIKRTSIARFSIALVLILWALIALFTLITHFAKSNGFAIFANILIFISTFFLAFFGLGIQSVLLYIPLEYKDYTPQKTSIFFSCLWGIGYIILTGYYILASVIDQCVHQIASLTFITILLVIYYLLVVRLRESRSEYMEFKDWLKENIFSRKKSVLEKLT